MLATAGRIPEGPGWAYEVKWDGMRALLDVGAGIRLTTRTEADATVAFPELAACGEALRQRGVTDVLVDGEVALLGADGNPSFAALGPRMHVGNARRAEELAAAAPATLVVFDIVRLAGEDLCPMPYWRRRELLAGLDLTGTAAQVPGAFDDGAALLAATAERGLEGVVAKRLDSPYTPGVRSRDWVKQAHRTTTSALVLGWRQGTGRPAGSVGSLALAVPDSDGGWAYAGTAGSGIDGATAQALGSVLESVPADVPAVGIPAVDLRSLMREGFRWCEPVLVVDIVHLGHSAGAKLRQPVVVAVRPDLNPADLLPPPAAARR